MEEMPIIFYKKNTCALGVLIAMEWLNKPYRLCRLEAQDLEEEAYLKFNPLGEVPALMNQEEFLTESLAILQHLGTQGLERKIAFRQGSKEYDQLNRVLAYLVSSFHKAFAPCFRPGAFHSDETVQAQIKKTVIDGTLRSQFQYVNDHLLDGGFLFDTPTIADAYLYATSRWGKHFYDLKSEFPNLASFQALMEQDPAVRFALQIEEEKITGPQHNFKGHVNLRLIAKSTDFDRQGLLVDVGAPPPENRSSPPNSLSIH